MLSPGPPAVAAVWCGSALRELHGIAASDPLMSRRLVELASETSRGRVGSPQWQRFAAARDASIPRSQPAAASARTRAGGLARKARPAGTRRHGRRSSGTSPEHVPHAAGLAAVSARLRMTCSCNTATSPRRSPLPPTRRRLDAYVQMAFGSKAGLLSDVIEVAVAGDEQERPLAERESWATMLNAGGEDTVRAFAGIVAGVYKRTAGLLAVAATAAEADEALAALQARSYGAGCVTAPRSSTGSTTTAGSIQPSP